MSINNLSITINFPTKKQFTFQLIVHKLIFPMPKYPPLYRGLYLKLFPVQHIPVYRKMSMFFHRLLMAIFRFKKKTEITEKKSILLVDNLLGKKIYFTKTEIG